MTVPEHLALLDLNDPQMIADQQTHLLPNSPQGWDRLAAFLGTGTEALKGDLEDRLQTEFEGSAELEWLPDPRAAVLRRPDTKPPRTGGRVGVITAGTSDIPWAEIAGMRDFIAHAYFSLDLAISLNSIPGIASSKRRGASKIPDSLPSRHGS